MYDLETIRHSCAHLLAQAVQRLFPNTKKAIGPATKDGFFYDFESDHIFSEKDLEIIQNEMLSIVKESLKIEKKKLSKNEAITLFSTLGESYKVEILEKIEDEPTIYQQGEYIDLCRGPHVENTSHLKAFKLASISGAYWKNNSNNKMLQRIYGYAFATKEDLNNYLNFLVEVEKRDHRKLGKELSLFMLDDAAIGSTFWLPKGMILRKIVESVSREMHSDYEEIKTPTIMSRKLWEQSGHWENYRENMYATEFENEELLVKPMNCPAAILLYKNSPKSYRDLPIRYFELGTVFRRELSGALHGLMRKREFTQDDAHLFISEDLLQQEILNVIKLADKILTKFGLKYKLFLSTKPEKYIGSQEIWEKATESLLSAIQASGKPYEINEGDGSFYGPKIDYQIEDAIGRKWQCSTIQLDFNLPERFNLEYIDSDNQKKRTIMVHRAIYGSIERFIGILIEHYEGKFPFWLAPIQIRIMTISEKTTEYAKKIHSMLKDDYRVELDIENERINQKIKRASLEKIPLQMIVGEEESKNELVNLREPGKESYNLSLKSLIEKLKNF